MSKRTEKRRADRRRTASVWMAHVMPDGTEVLDHAETRPLPRAGEIYNHYAGNLEAELDRNAGGRYGVVQYIELREGSRVLARREVRS